MNMASMKDLIRRRPRTAWAAASALAALAVTTAILGRTRGTGAQTEPTFEVQRGPLTISVLQSGTIQAMQQQILTSEVEGQTTLIFVIEEGTRVAKGDLLAELDASQLQDNLVEQQIRTQNAEAAYVRARENFAVTKSQAESDIALAELDFRFAKEDLTRYAEGEYKQELRTAESKITLAEEELQLAARKMEWSEKLFAENYISQSERDADRLSHKRASLDLELAKAAKRLLEEFTYTRELAQRESDVTQTERALERSRLKASADIVQAEADLKAKEAEWRQQQGKEEKIGRQIEKTKIYAPREGLVVYATSVKTGWRGGSEPLAAGQSVRERQELIYLPTAEQMMAVVQVHESSLDMIRIGLPVIVTVDAVQGRTFFGKVTRIAPLPDATSMWMNPDLKVYRTEIEIEGRQPALRTGMSCMAEVIVERYEDAVYVPVQSVLRIEGRPSVYVRRGREFQRIPVEVGLDNNRVVRILSGLKNGETVLLTPPLQAAAAGEERNPGHGEIGDDRLRDMIKDAQATRPAETAAQPAESAEDEGAAPRAGSNLGEEQRAELRRRLNSMTPEQREEAAKRVGRGRTGEGQRRGGESGGNGR